MGRAVPRSRIRAPSDDPKALHFGFNVIGFQVKVHTFLGDLFIAGLLEKDSYLRVRKTEPAIYMAAIFRQGLFGSVKCC
jgi:hypothetical protein